MSGESFFRSASEQRMRGGCDDCDAYQVLDASRAPLYRLIVHHDETCPWLKAKEVAS